MECYSLINALEHQSKGIYTSLENLYVALKDCVQKDLSYGYPKEDVMLWYEIKQVFLDYEPLKYHEFSTHGKQIEIDWNKIFKK
jgi:hypothetical protein